MVSSISHVKPDSHNSNQLQIGDFVPKDGIYTKPGVVQEIRPNGDVVVNTEDSAISKYHRHAITTGLTPEEKDKFNIIMDSVMEMKTNDERLLSLQNSIDNLKSDPQNKKIAGMLHNEQARLIRMSKELPKIYTVPEDKLQN